jgi:hypothetical protein
LAGLTSAGQIRFEAPAPFGRPAFILAGSAVSATLVTRDNQVLMAPAADILEALVGVSLEPAALLTFLSGCGLAGEAVQPPTRYGDLLSIRTSEGRAFLASIAGHWRVSAVERGGLVVEYRHDPSRSEVWPRQIFLNSAPGRRPEIALSIAQSQIEVNVPLEASAFTVSAPQNATPLSLDDLRAAGPLGDR